MTLTTTTTAACACRCGCRAPLEVSLPKAAGRLATLLRCPACLASCVPSTVKDGGDVDTLQREANLARFDAAMPAEFANATSSDATVTDRLQRWGRSPGASLLVTGPPGVGKTYLGYALCRALVAGGAVGGSAIVHGHESDVLGRITYSQINDSEQQLRRLCDPAAVQVLFIDDLGRGRYLTSARRLEVLEQVIDAFYRTRRTLVITTNLTVADLSVYLGAATLDRLAHVCRDQAGDSVVTLTGASRRTALREQARQANRSLTP